MSEKKSEIDELASIMKMNSQMSDLMSNINTELSNIFDKPDIKFGLFMFSDTLSTIVSGVDKEIILKRMSEFSKNHENVKDVPVASGDLKKDNSNNTQKH